MSWLSIVADVLSILGFLMTVWVLALTRSLKRRFALRGRIPDLRKELAAGAANFRPLINEWPGRTNDGVKVLSTIRALLENLRTKLPHSERSAVSRIVRQIDGKDDLTWKGRFRKRHLTELPEGQLWKIFGDLEALITTLEQRERDFTWE